MPPSYVKTNQPGLVRDLKSGAILNTNLTELEVFRAERERHLANQNLKLQVDGIRDELDSLKVLITGLMKEKT